MGRATGGDKVLVRDFDHRQLVTGEGIGTSVESSSEGRELDRFRLQRAVREERLGLLVLRVDYGDSSASITVIPTLSESSNRLPTVFAELV